MTDAQCVENQRLTGELVEVTRQRDALTITLATLKAELESGIDGGEECRGRDSQLTGWIRLIDEARNKRGS